MKSSLWVLGPRGDHPQIKFVTGNDTLPLCLAQVLFMDHSFAENVGVGDLSFVWWSAI